MDYNVVRSLNPAQHRFFNNMSADKSFQRILLAPGSSLKPLIEHSRLLEALADTLRQGIDQPFADHINLGNIRGDTAVITTDSPAWLSKIRYLEPVLLRILQQQSGMSSVKKIQFKVAPNDMAQSSMPPLHRAELSQQSAEILKSTASGIQDPDLAAALLRLAKQAGRAS